MILFLGSHVGLIVSSQNKSAFTMLKRTFSEYYNTDCVESLIFSWDIKREKKVPYKSDRPRYSCVASQIEENPPLFSHSAGRFNMARVINIRTRL